MEVPWILLKRLVGLFLPTPADEMEGQLRYDRDGAVDGKLWLARKLSGGANEWAAIVLAAASQTLSRKTVDTTNTVDLLDTLFTLHDDGDATKQARLQLSAITTGTTRTYALPNASTTLVGNDNSQLLTNKSLGDTTFTGAHLFTNTTGGGPGIAALAAAGSTASAVSLIGTDLCGRVAVTPSGTGIAAGSILEFTFEYAQASTNYGVWLSPHSSAARSLGGVVGNTNRTTTTFEIDTRTALTSGSIYQWAYWVFRYG